MGAVLGIAGILAVQAAGGSIELADDIARVAFGFTEPTGYPSWLHPAATIVELVWWALTASLVGSAVYYSIEAARLRSARGVRSRRAPRLLNGRDS